MGKGVDKVAVDNIESFRPGFPASQRHLAFGWYGGKFSHLDWLLPLFPSDASHFCDVFGGSASVVLNVHGDRALTYNDLDGDLVNFFRMLRDRPEDLVRLIELTPFSREEYAVAIGACDQPDDLERARRFYVRARQSRTGLAQSATLGRWANHREILRRGMPGGVSKWVGGTQGLMAVAARLRTIQIENRPAVDFVQAYDHESMFLYVDPPYVHDTRGDAKVYAYEMTDAEHAELAGALRSSRGRVAVSGYRCALMDELYAGWTRRDAPAKSCAASGGVRRESLWMNYTPPRARRGATAARRTKAVGAKARA